jgi:DNA-binding NtrC family response regulator
LLVLELCLLTVKYDNNQYWVLSDGAILIVNDDQDIAELFAAGLEHSGFQTTICDDALSAVEKIRSSPDQFTLVLVDRTSQQETDFPKQVKSINNKMKVVLASAFTFSDVEISNCGYDQVLQLPITISKLVSTVREVLG